MTRGLVAAGLTLLIGGCNANSDQARYFALVKRVITGERTVVARDQAAAIPFASIGVTLGRSNEALMVLGLDEEGRQEWYARTQMVAMRNGRIVQTAGLPYDLTRLEVREGTGALTMPSGPPSPGSRYSLVVDFQDLRLIGAAADCTSSDVGEEMIEILGTRLMTRHLIERCKIALIDWSFSNDFWVDPGNGFIWQSSQYVHPKLSPLMIRVLRPPIG